MNSVRTLPLPQWGASALLPLAVALALTWGLYGASLQGWWCCDDPAILLHARRYGFWQLMLDPQAYRALIPYSLQPLLSVSFGLDLAWFGLEPGGFYLHQLLVIALCGWLVQRLAALWVPLPLAWAAMVLFLVGGPVAFASQYLMVRHYVDGLLLFGLALWWLLLHLRGGAPWLRWLSVLAFALAVSAKEVFVPLGLLPLLLPVASPQARWRAAWPWLAVLVLYVGWRRFMLGEFLGGYQPPGYFPPVSLDLLVQSLRGAAQLLWPWLWPWLLVGAMLLAGAWRWLRERPAMPGWQGWVAYRAWPLALAGMLVGPLLPLAGFPGFGPGAERYLLVAWAALVLILVLAWGRGAVWHHWLGTALVLVLAGAAWAHSQQVLQRSVPYLQKSRAVGEFFLSAPVGQAALVNTDIPGWFVLGLRDLRPDAKPRTGVLLEPVAPDAGLDAEAPALPLADESALARLEPPQRRVFAFDGAAGAMREVPNGGAQMLHDWRKRLSDAVVGVELIYVAAQQGLHVQFSGPPGAVFFVVSGGSLQIVPQRFGLRVNGPPRECLRIRVDLPDGRLAYSPMLQLQPVNDDSGNWALRWQGPGLLPDDSDWREGAARCRPVPAPARR